MLNYIVTSLVGIITFTLLDYVWLAHVAKSFYLKNLAVHITLKDGALVPYLPAIPLVYLVAVLGIWIFVLPKVSTLSSAFIVGALFGFVTYAFYDFTNLATLRDYPWSLTIIDTLWGTFLVGLVSACMFLVSKFLS
jgi:uncharacterized membrane protein